MSTTDWHPARFTCPCGWTPDPGRRLGAAGCNCGDSNNLAEVRRRDRHRRTRKPCIFYALGAWRVMGFDYQRGWSRAVAWVEAR